MPPQEFEVKEWKKGQKELEIEKKWGRIVEMLLVFQNWVIFNQIEFKESPYR